MSTVAPIKNKVSICLPTFNRANFLAPTLHAILSQTFKDFEVIICDDNSSDNTAQIVQSFSDPRIRYIKNDKNLGLPKILNKLIAFAQGEYIIFLHDHDLYLPTLLEEMVRRLDHNPNVGYVFCGVEVIDDKNKVKQKYVMPYPEVMTSKEIVNIILNRFRFDCPVSALSMIRTIHLSAVTENNVFDETFGFISDVDLWLRLAMKYEVGYIAKPLIKVRERENDHPFKKPNWKLYILIGKVYRTNIRRYCTDPIGFMVRMTWFWLRYGLMGIVYVAKLFICTIKAK